MKTKQIKAQNDMSASLLDLLEAVGCARACYRPNKNEVRFRIKVHQLCVLTLGISDSSIVLMVSASLFIHRPCLLCLCALLF